MERSFSVKMIPHTVTEGNNKTRNYFPPHIAPRIVRLMRPGSLPSVVVRHVVTLIAGMSPYKSKRHCIVAEVTIAFRDERIKLFPQISVCDAVEVSLSPVIDPASYSIDKVFAVSVNIDWLEAALLVMLVEDPDRRAELAAVVRLPFHWVQRQGKVSRVVRSIVPSKAPASLAAAIVEARAINVNNQGIWASRKYSAT